jgi:hypothetical protein
LNSNEPIVIESEVTKNESKYTPGEIVTLRVRTETGKRNLIVKLLVTDKMPLVYQMIRPYLENPKVASFELRTNFPNKAYVESETKNLKELGLYPSCALVVQVK